MTRQHPSSPLTEKLRHEPTAAGRLGSLTSPRAVIHSYLRLDLGSCRVGGLTIQQLKLHLLQLLQRGGHRGGPLTRNTVKYAHAILRQALKEAVRHGLLNDFSWSDPTWIRLTSART